MTPQPTIRHLGYLPHADRLTFVEGGAGRLLDAPAVAVLLRYVQAHGDTEAGGILLGRYTHEGGVIVDDATEPAPADERLARSFVRNDDAHVQRVYAAWYASDGRVHYLGEWHTHSEPDPIPSALDYETWRLNWIDARATSGGDAPTLNVIVGQRSVGLWECSAPALPSAANDVASSHALSNGAPRALPSAAIAALHDAVDTALDGLDPEAVLAERREP